MLLAPLRWDVGCLFPLHLPPAPSLCPLWFCICHVPCFNPWLWPLRAAESDPRSGPLQSLTADSAPSALGARSELLGAGLQAAGAVTSGSDCSSPSGTACQSGPSTHLAGLAFRLTWLSRAHV